MRRQTLIFLLFTALFAGLASAQQNDPSAVSCTQFMAWSAGGMSSQRLLRLAQQRGISFTLDAPASQLLLTAGAEPAVLQNLRKTSLGSIHSDPGKADAACSAPLAHAAELIQQKRYQEAQSVLRKLIAADPGNAALYFALGYVHQQQEDWDEALESYQDSEDKMPGLSDVHSRLAYLFYRDDDPDNAIAEARTALSIDPRNAEAYRFLGLGLYGNTQYAAAIHAFHESLARDPNSADVYYDLGITLRDKGDIDAAAAAYRKAIALNPQLWEAHNNLGLLLHDMKSFDGAIAEYLEAKRLAPDESVVRNNLGNTYCDKGDYTAAITELRELFRMDSGWQNGHSCLARALMSRRDYESAIVELRAAILQNPSSPDEHRYLGQTLMLVHRQDGSDPRVAPGRPVGSGFPAGPSLSRHCPLQHRGFHRRRNRISPGRAPATDSQQSLLPGGLSDDHAALRRSSSRVGYGGSTRARARPVSHPQARTVKAHAGLERALTVGQLLEVPEWEPKTIKTRSGMAS